VNAAHKELKDEAKRKKKERHRSTDEPKAMEADEEAVNGNWRTTRG
jgi:hypothetical protein